MPLGRYAKRQANLQSLCAYIKRFHAVVAIVATTGRAAGLGDPPKAMGAPNPCKMTFSGAR